MRYIQIKDLPKVVLAHAYSANEYYHTIPIQENGGIMEICYCSKGRIPVRYGDEKVVQNQYDFTCNLYDKPTIVAAADYHEHHTLKFLVKYEICKKENTNAFHLPLFVSTDSYGKAHEILDEIIRLYTLGENEITLAGLCLQLLSEYDKLSKRTTPSSMHLIKAKEYIYNHLQQPIEQKKLAAYLGITPEYLCAVFKKETGSTLMQFINRTKLSKIRDVMDRENLKLYEASELYGYTDPNYVSRIFKKYYGKNVTDK